MRLKIILLLLVTISFYANAQNWDWGQHFSGDLNNNGKCIDEDALSNLYITGTFTGNISLGNISLSSSTPTSYLAKLDPSGTYLWAKKINCNIHDIAVENDIVISGSFSDFLKIDQSIIVSQGGEDAIIAKFDFSGNLIWIKQGMGSGNDEFKNIKRNSSGDIFITGTVGNSMTVNNTGFSTGACIIVFDPSGNISTNINVGANCAGWEISTDAHDDIYLLCGYYDEIIIDGTSYQADHYGSHFIAKYSRAGNFMWFKDLGNNYYYPYKNLKVTRNGEIYLSKNHRYSDIQLTKFSRFGDVIWDKYYGGSVYDGCFDLELDNTGNIYMTGNYWYNASYGSISVSGTEGCMFLTKLDSTGNALWVKSATDSQGNIFGKESCFKNSDHGYLVGFCSGNSQLDANNVSGSFLAKLSLNTTTEVVAISSEENLIRVYPNPGIGIFTIDFTEIKGENKSIMIYDLNGKCVYQQFNLPSNNNITIDIKNLPKGIYSVELVAGKKKWIKKLIKN